MPSKTPWIECRRPPTNPSRRVFCFPFAGGAAQSFRLWQAALGDDIDVCPIQPPGRWSRFREQPLTQVQAMASAALEALKQGQWLDDVPYALYGHSMGALVAYELAQQLREAAAARQPDCVMVGACPAPQIHQTPKPTYMLPQAEFVRWVNQRYESIPPQVLQEPEMLALVVPALRGDLQAFQTYDYSEAAPLEQPLLGFNGSDDHLVSGEKMQGWERRTGARFELHPIAGKHLFCTEPTEQMMALVKRWSSGELS